MITRLEFTRGQIVPAELEENIIKTLKALNQFRGAYALPMVVTSGLRTPSHNLKVGGRPQSAHLTGEACDFHDTDQQLARFCLENYDILEECGLYLEDPRFTPGWVHLQTRKPKSGNRVFIP